MFRCEKEGCGVEITGIRGVRAKKNYCEKHYFEEIGKEMKPKEKPKKQVKKEKQKEDLRIKME